MQGRRWRVDEDDVGVSRHILNRALHAGHAPIVAGAAVGSGFGYNSPIAVRSISNFIRQNLTRGIHLQNLRP